MAPPVHCPLAVVRPDKMSSKKVSGVSVIITCQEEEAGTDLTTDEYDQLVKVLKIVRKIFIPHLSSLFPR